MTRSQNQPREAGLTVIRDGPGFFARHRNWKWKLGTLCLLGVAAVIAYPSPVSAQTQTGHTELVTDHVDTAQGGKEFGDFVVVPIPIVNPTFGNGLAVGGAYLYKFDEGSQTSFTGAGGFYTDSKSWGAGIGTVANFKEDAWKIKGGLAYFDLTLDFYGIGSDAGENDTFVPLNNKGIGLLVSALRRIVGKWYVGASYSFVDIQSTFDLSGVGGESPIPLPPEAELDSQVAGLGLILEYLTKDNQFNAYKGQLFKITWSESGSAVGSDFDFSSVNARYNHYFSLNKKEDEGHMTLAVTGTACATPGETPFYALCKFGTMLNLRGYVGGRFRDKTMLTTQAEYRWRFYKRWGAVAFAGVGQVAENFGDYNTDNLLPSAGIGARFMLSEKNRLNLSVDYAIGKDTSALYFYVAESF